MTVTCFLLIVDSTGDPSPWVGVIDGLFDDWAAVDTAYHDPRGDHRESDIDFGVLQAASDSARIYLSFEIGVERNLQSGNHIVMYLDTDNTPESGLSVEDIGAEIEWDFGRRMGTAHIHGDTVRLNPASLGLRQGPTVSSKRFEISLKRSAMVRRTSLFPGDTMSIVLRVEQDGIQDILPDAGERLELICDHHGTFPYPTASIHRLDPAHLRVVTYNVLFDGLFERPGPFVSVFRALDPDIICLQEIWNHSAKETADMIALALPDASWYAVKSHEGIIVSRYPIIDSCSTSEEAGNIWALIDLPDERYATDLSVINAHPPCCDNDVGRELELDAIAAWIRELKSPEEHRLPQGTPMVVAGDMNLVGPARQLEILLAGQIINQDRFGKPAPPDWDGTELADVMPYHTTGRESYTWRSLSHYDGSFSPGRLDYILYTDSILELKNHFVLCTEEMTPEELRSANLLSYETAIASDHLPVVADFVVPMINVPQNVEH